MGLNELDRALGSSQGYTCNLLRRNSRPRADFVGKLATALGVRLEYLLNGEEPMDAPAAPNSVVVCPTATRKRVRGAPTIRQSAVVDPCPSRTIVVALARAQGVPEAAIAALLAERCDDEDPGEEYWYTRLAYHIEKARYVQKLISGDG